VIILNKRDAIARAVERAAAARAPQLPLLTAVAAGRLETVFIRDASNPWPRRVERAKIPVVVVVGADQGEDTDPLPAEWRCLRHAIHWQRFFVCHAAGGEESHYRTAVDLAERFRRVLLVECTSRTARFWADAIQCEPERGWLIWALNGSHPIRPSVVH